MIFIVVTCFIKLQKSFPRAVRSEEMQSEVLSLRQFLGDIQSSVKVLYRPCYIVRFEREERNVENIRLQILHVEYFYLLVSKPRLDKYNFYYCFLVYILRSACAESSASKLFHTLCVNFIIL